MIINIDYICDMVIKHNKILKEIIDFAYKNQMQITIGDLIILTGDEGKYIVGCNYKSLSKLKKWQIRPIKELIPIEDIESVVLEYSGLDKKTLHMKTRKAEILKWRQIAQYFGKEYSGYSLGSIGKAIGNKDHATVIHSCKVVNQLVQTNGRYEKIVNDIRNRVEQRIKDKIFKD